MLNTDTVTASRPIARPHLHQQDTSSVILCRFYFCDTIASKLGLFHFIYYFKTHFFNGEPVRSLEVEGLGRAVDDSVQHGLSIHHDPVGRKRPHTLQTVTKHPLKIFDGEVPETSQRGLDSAFSDMDLTQ